MNKTRLIKGGLFPIYLSLFHVAFIVLMGIFCSYHFHSGSEEVPGLYASKFKLNDIYLGILINKY